MTTYTEEICSTCNGSGEGAADGTTCWNCKGKGVEWVKEEEEEENTSYEAKCDKRDELIDRRFED